MSRVLLAILFSLTALTAGADQPMSAEAFDRYTQGKTLFFGQDGQFYGAERYLPGRRVLWTFLDGECKDGYWYEDGPNICFIYEDSPEPQCWQFSLRSDGLTAIFQNDPSVPLELYEAHEGGEMECRGPRIGV